MKRIVIDYLRRWKWAFVIGFVLHAAVMTFAWMDDEAVIPISVLSGSGFLLMFEFFRGGSSRTYLSFPITAKDLARAWRFVALVFPAVFFLVALVLSALIASMIKPTYLLNIDRFLILAGFQTAMIGVIFYALTGLPASPADQRTVQDSIKGGFYGLMWGFSIPGCIVLAQALPKNFAGFGAMEWFVAVCLILVTIGGWFRAESLVRTRSQQVNRAPRSRKSTDRAASLAAIRKFGGIPFHCFHIARLAGTLGLAMILLNWGWMQFFSNNPPSAREIDHQFTASQINFVVPIMATLIGIVGLGQLRSLRSLPLSRGQIAGILILWPMGFGLLFGFLVVVLHWLWFGPPFLWENLGRSIAGASLLLLTIPVFLRVGFTLKGFVVIMIALPAVQMLQLLSEDRMAAVRPHLWWISVILVPLAFWLSMRLLNSSHPWRCGALVMKNMTGR